MSESGRHLPVPRPAPQADIPHHRRDPRWFPRGALVFLALAVAAVVLLMIARPHWFDGFGGPNDPPGLAYSRSLAGLGHRDGVRLSDDSANSRSFTAVLPVDSRLVETRLVIRGRTQAASAGTAFLRVSADQESIYVGELPSGDHDLSVDLQLPDGVTGDGSVTVQVRVTGGLEQRLCNVDHEVGALVSLDAVETRFEGRLDRPLHTVRDVAGALNRDVTLDLAMADGDRTWFQTAARLGVALTQRGRKVTYRSVDDADTAAGSGSRILVGPAERLAELGWTAADDQETGAVRVGYVEDSAVLAVVDPTGDVVAPLPAPGGEADFVADIPRTDDPERLAEDVVSLDSLGLDTSVQYVTKTRSWRTSYSLAELPGGRRPSEIRLDLHVPVVAENAQWVVQIELNGQLLNSARLPGDGVIHPVGAVIPEGVEALRNQLVVTLLLDRDVGGCNVRTPTYQAQMLPTSNLLLAGPGAGFAAVPAEFAAGFDVHLSDSSADGAAAALSSLVPTLAEFSGPDQQPRFVWDAEPGERSFFLFGQPPPAVEAPVRMVDGQFVATALDLPAVTDGLVVERAAARAARGVVVIPAGKPPGLTADFGTEDVLVVTPHGDGIVVSNPRPATPPEGEP